MLEMATLQEVSIVKVLQRKYMPLFYHGNNEKIQELKEFRLLARVGSHYTRFCTFTHFVAPLKCFLTRHGNVINQNSD